MCTSFAVHKSSMLVAMNFDNNGMPYNISIKNPEQFVVLVDGGRGKYPSFGVNSNGTFINNLSVDSNGKGLYKRASKKVTHTSKFSDDIFSGRITPTDIDEYLANVEVVNTPDSSVHNMIVDRDGNVWIVEPGRGVIHSNVGETPFVMTNFSLLDMESRGEVYGDGADRYETAKNMLAHNSILDVNAAFEILSATKQSSGEWTTAFSMVYSHAERTVYYCYNGDFTNILKHTFNS